MKILTFSRESHMIKTEQEKEYKGKINLKGCFQWVLKNRILPVGKHTVGFSLYPCSSETFEKEAGREKAESLWCKGLKKRKPRNNQIY